MLQNLFLSLLIILSVLNTILSFNLSPLPNIIIRKPNLQTFKPQNRSSYFGFSLVLREKSLIIGAPRAQSTLWTQANIDETGDIYKCPLNLKRSTTETSQIDCSPFIFEKNGNILDTSHSTRNEFRDYQWLGAAMDGGSNDSEPLLVCAPRLDGGPRNNADDVGYMHGICYRSANTLEENAVQVWRLKPFAVDQRYQIVRSTYFYQLAQLGLSAHITPNNNEYVMGAPGFNNWLGSAVRFREGLSFDIPNDFSRKALIYTGYAVGSGYLDDLYRNRLIYVTTAPHENMYFGKAFVYSYNARNGIDIKAAFTGYQYGEYYGYALLVSDINGDGLDDIIITAPQHRVNGIADIGAIYVYVNKGRYQFLREIIEAPFRTTARFGTTISSLGDINHDGYNDIAVGAPFYDGSGAVVIYHGGPNGLQLEAKQILKLPENLRTPTEKNNYFGHGLSKGVDIDGNGYTDLAIGAPNSETVYIYRSYPVVNVAVSLKASEKSIKPKTDQINFEVCFQLDQELPTALLLELRADSRLRRLRFQDNNLNQLSQTVLAANFRKCQNFGVNIVFVANQMFTPLEMELSYSLIKNGTQQANQSFCNDCLVMDPSISRSQTAFVKYNPGCESDICKVDLSIVSNELPSKFIIGEVKAFKIGYNIENKGEKAFDTQVTITNSLNLTLTRMPSNCFELVEYELICDIAKGVNALEKTAYLEIEYDLKNVTEANELLITATIASTGFEMNDLDNQVINEIQFERSSSVDIVGYPLENLLSIGDDETTLQADFVYRLENHGPSAVKNFTLILQMPIAYLDENQKQMNFINISDIRFRAYYGSQEISGAEFQIISNEMNEDSANLNEIWQNLESLGLTINKTRLQHCQNSKTTLCARSLLRLDFLESMENLRLKLRVKFNTTILRDMLKGSQNFMGFYVDVAMALNSKLGSSLNITKSIEPIAIEYRTVPERPIWIYLVAILGGLLLLALLILGLVKLGFFKRTKKEEMQKLIKNNDEPVEAGNIGPLENGQNGH